MVILFSFWSGNTKQQYGHASVTNNGETVKSIGEKQIADYLSSLNIRYIYEKEVRSRGILFTKHISNPDFYLPDYNVYIEYWGLVNADKRKVREDYVRTMKWKMRQYHNAGIKFVSIYPKNLRYLDWIFRKKFEKATGKRLP